MNEVLLSHIISYGQPPYIPIKDQHISNLVNHVIEFINNGQEDTEKLCLSLLSDKSIAAVNNLSIIINNLIRSHLYSHNISLIFDEFISPNAIEMNTQIITLIASFYVGFAIRGQLKK